MRLKKYLTESKFKSSYKEGDEIKVSAVRRPIYKHYAHVPSEQETTKTLIVSKKIKKNSYVVTIKGTREKRFGPDINIPITGQLIITEPDFGILNTEKAKWEVYVK